MFLFQAALIMICLQRPSSYEVPGICRTQSHEKVDIYEVLVFVIANSSDINSALFAAAAALDVLKYYRWNIFKYQTVSSSGYNVPSSNEFY